jgi:hypothetical protein
MNIVREEEVVSPINNLSVDIVSVLGTKGWVSWWSASPGTLTRSD